MKKTRGVICSGSRESAKLGAEIYNQGGNAFDAAVAATFMGFMSEPMFTTLGGGGFAALYNKSKGEACVIDFSCAAPTPDPRKELNFVKTTATYGDAVETIFLGRGTCAVPGNPAGLAYIHQNYGKLPLDVILPPVIDACINGLPLTNEQAHIFTHYVGILDFTDSIRKLFHKNGNLKKGGDIFINKDLGNTLNLLLKNGFDFFYRGDIAQQIAHDQQENGGLLTTDDFASYKPKYRKPFKGVFTNFN
jgi:gamma-glutamyltranspeptidase/glutathione hydrolase